MKPANLAIAALAFAHLAALAGARPLAGEEAFAPISRTRLRAGRYHPAEKLQVTGKYRELINSELRLQHLNIRFLLAQPSLTRFIYDLGSAKDNLILRGSFAEAPPSPDLPPVFNVEAIAIAPGDAKLYEERRAALGSSPDGDAPGPWRELADEVTEDLRLSPNPELARTAREIFREVFQRSAASLAATDADGRLQLIREAHQQLGDGELTLELLVSQLERFPDHLPTRKLLEDTGFRAVGGRWLSYGEFKRKLGFVRRGEEWVKPARKEILDLEAKLKGQNQTNLILRVRTDREYALLAQSGKVEKGMTREELSAAIGFADRVERESWEANELDQWNYGDRRVYLFNGQVVAVAP